MKRGVKIALVGALVVAVLFLIPSLVGQLAFRGVQKELANMEGKECRIDVYVYLDDRETLHLTETEDQAEFLALCRQLEYGGVDWKLPGGSWTGGGERAYTIMMSRQGGKHISITLSNWEGNNYTCDGFLNSCGVHLDNTQPLYDYLETLFEAQ